MSGDIGDIIGNNGAEDDDDLGAVIPVQHFDGAEQPAVEGDPPIDLPQPPGADGQGVVPVAPVAHPNPPQPPLGAHIDHVHEEQALVAAELAPHAPIPEVNVVDGLIGDGAGVVGDVDVVDNGVEDLELSGYKMWSNRMKKQQKIQRELVDKITNCSPMDDIRILLACGANINDAVVQGLRPLHYAVYGNNADCVKLLLIRGCDVNALGSLSLYSQGEYAKATNDVGYSALHLSAEHGYLDICKLLMEYGSRVTYSNPDDQELFPRSYKLDEPLRLAIKGGHYGCAAALLQNGANPGTRYFLGSEISLIPPSKATFLRLLLRFGADPNVYDRDGFTPLMRACRVKEGLGSVEVLLEYGAYVNARALARQDHRTPLHFSILSGNTLLLQRLLREGAKINISEHYNRASPLDLAVLKGDLVVLKILLRNGGNPLAVHTYIGSPLHLAACSNLPNQFEILHTLLQYGADPNLCPHFQEGYLKSPLVEYIRSIDEPRADIIQLFLAFGGRIIMESAIHNPNGMLRNLLRVHQLPPVWWLLLEAGERYSLVSSERLLLPRSKKMELMAVASSPPSLLHLSRLTIRNRSLAPFNPEKAAELGLPEHLETYLSYGFARRKYRQYAIV